MLYILPGGSEEDDENVKIKVYKQSDNRQHAIKQEAHGPHRSPEKTVQINKHI